MIKIVQNGEPVLRQIAHEIPEAEITSAKTQAIIKRMIAALESQDDGVAIAAPQIGEAVRIFIVSGKIFDSNYPDIAEGAPIPPHLVCINPKITKLSKTKKWLPEGCLSVRWLYGNVQRATKAEIRAYDEQGQIFTRGGSGLLAQIFQHENDHLDGILFIDKAEDLQDTPPEHDE